MQTLKKARPCFSQYPTGAALGGWTHQYWEVMRVQTDGVPGLGACGVRWLAKMLSAGGSPAVWSYMFARATTTPPLSDGFTAPHASEGATRK
jgi:hypothetical protein